jgi:Arc/MetJ-type ribon-helix-helix transcriptional regulator
MLRLFIFWTRHACGPTIGTQGRHTVRTHVSLPDDLVKDIDELVGKRKRSEFIADALEKSVRSEKMLRVIKEGAGILSDEDYPYWSTPEKVAQWLRDLRDTPSIRELPDVRTPPRRKRTNILAKGSPARS